LSIAFHVSELQPHESSSETRRSARCRRRGTALQPHESSSETITKHASSSTIFNFNLTRVRLKLHRLGGVEAGAGELQPHESSSETPAVYRRQGLAPDFNLTRVRLKRRSGMGRRDDRRTSTSREFV